MAWAPPDHRHLKGAKIRFVMGFGFGCAWCVYIAAAKAKCKNAKNKNDLTCLLKLLIKMMRPPAQVASGAHTQTPNKTPKGLLSCCCCFLVFLVSSVRFGIYFELSRGRVREFESSEKFKVREKLSLLCLRCKTTREKAKKGEGYFVSRVVESTNLT